MTNSTVLVAELRRRILNLEDDLRARLRGLSDVDAGWRAEHRRALEPDVRRARGSNGATIGIHPGRCAWVLTTVSVRFCEDKMAARGHCLSSGPVRNVGLGE
jgi:hypothetical protein